MSGSQIKKVKNVIDSVKNQNLLNFLLEYKGQVHTLGCEQKGQTWLTRLNHALKGQR